MTPKSQDTPAQPTEMGTLPAFVRWLLVRRLLRAGVLMATPTTSPDWGTQLDNGLCLTCGPIFSRVITGLHC